MTDPQMACPSCQRTTCPDPTGSQLAQMLGQPTGTASRCCPSCTGSHADAAYDRYYPKDKNR